MKIKSILLLIVWASVSALSSAQNALLIPDTLGGQDIQLTLQRGSTNFYPDKATQTMGANGSLLGPTLILKKGQWVDIQLKNELGEPSTIHWHGMHVSAKNDGGPHIVIMPDSTWNPSFTVLDPASTHWYHPHLHHMTNEHVQRGIAGFVIVRDEEEAALNLPRTYGVDDFPLAVQSKFFDADRQIVVESALDSVVMVNGTIRPFLEVPAQVIRLRLLNGSSERVYNFGFSNNLEFSLIGTDGGLLKAPVKLTRLQLAPGERAEILINMSEKQSQTHYLMSYGSELPNAIYGARQPGMGQGQTIPGYSSNPLNGNNFNVLELRVKGATSNAITTISASLANFTAYSAAQAQVTRTLTFTSVNMGPTAIQGPFRINNQLFDMDRIDYIIPLNNIEIWELRNQTPIAHPFHIHMVPFYILDINGVAPAAHLQGKKDVVLVPGGNGVVRFITQFKTFADDEHPYMYHCHMLTHEDDGMMGQFLVVNPCTLDFSAEPSDLAQNAGTEAVFTAKANDENAVYLWQTNLGFGFVNLSDAGQYSGTASDSLRISNIGAGNQNQQFRCIVQLGNCTDTSATVRLQVNGINALDHVPSIVQSLQVYPNPGHRNINIHYRGNSNIKAAIYSTDGKLIHEVQLSEAHNKLNLGHLAPGLYHLQSPAFSGAIRFVVLP